MRHCIGGPHRVFRFREKSNPSFLGLIGRCMRDGLSERSRAMTYRVNWLRLGVGVAAAVTVGAGVVLATIPDAVG